MQSKCRDKALRLRQYASRDTGDVSVEDCAGGLCVSTAAEFPGEFENVGAAFAAEVHADFALVSLGEENGDEDSFDGAGDVDLVVDVGGGASCAGDFGVVGGAPGEAGIVADACVAVDDGHELEFAGGVTAVEALAEVGNIDAGEREIVSDFEAARGGVWQREALRVGVYTGVEECGRLSGDGVIERPECLVDHFGGAAASAVDPVVRAEADVCVVVVDVDDGDAGECFELSVEIDAWGLGGIDDENGVAGFHFVVGGGTEFGHFSQEGETAGNGAGGERGVDVFSRGTKSAGECAHGAEAVGVRRDVSDEEQAACGVDGLADIRRCGLIRR